MHIRIRLDQQDLEITREALAYMGRRIRAPRDSRLIEEMQDWFEGRLLDRPPPGAVSDAGPAARQGKAPRRPAARQGKAPRGSRLSLGKEHARVLMTVLESYAEELGRPLSDLSNRARVTRMREIVRRLKRASSRFGRIAAWLTGG
jgi:hypothetical protein